MKSMIRRGFFLTFLFTFTIALYTYFLLAKPLKDSWRVFFDIQFANIPLGLWIMTMTALLGFGIALWVFTIGRAKNKAIEQYVTSLADSDPTATPVSQIPPPIQRALHDVSNVLSTQRNRLKKIIDERAEAQDRLIQERVVEERQRLARELHDSVSQQLFAASMLLSAMTESEEEQNPLLPQVEKMVQQAQLEMRALLLHLRPAALNNKSIAEGLEDLLLELREKVFFDIQFRLEEVPLSKGAEDHLFRIAQETLSNTLRHAQATEVDVLFVERDGLAIFRVQDNGVGFKQTDEKTGSYGLQNVKERAIEMGATCKIVSVPAQGTIVEVKLPVAKGVLEND